MAQLDKETIQNLTKLSRISCTPEEQEKLLGDLKKIIAFVDQLDALNTENVEPCNHVLEGIANVMREDTVSDTLPRETFLANAPSHTGGMIRVPPVLKSN